MNADSHGRLTPAPISPETQWITRAIQPKFVSFDCCGTLITLEMGTDCVSSSSSVSIG
jgi:hypothetical protein